MRNLTHRKTTRTATVALSLHDRRHHHLPVMEIVAAHCVAFSLRGVRLG